MSLPPSMLPPPFSTSGSDVKGAGVEQEAVFIAPSGLSQATLQPSGTNPPLPPAAAASRHVSDARGSLNSTLAHYDADVTDECGSSRQVEQEPVVEVEVAGGSHNMFDAPHDNLTVPQRRVHGTVCNHGEHDGVNAADHAPTADGNHHHRQSQQSQPHQGPDGLRRRYRGRNVDSENRETIHVYQESECLEDEDEETRLEREHAAAFEDTVTSHCFSGGAERSSSRCRYHHHDDEREDDVDDFDGQRKTVNLLQLSGTLDVCESAARRPQRPPLLQPTWRGKVHPCGGGGSSSNGTGSQLSPRDCGTQKGRHTRGAVQMRGEGTTIPSSETAIQGDEFTLGSRWCSPRNERQIQQTQQAQTQQSASLLSRQGLGRYGCSNNYFDGGAGPMTGWQEVHPQPARPSANAATAADPHTSTAVAATAPAAESTATATAAGDGDDEGGDAFHGVTTTGPTTEESISGCTIHASNGDYSNDSSFSSPPRGSHASSCSGAQHRRDSLGIGGGMGGMVRGRGDLRDSGGMCGSSGPGTRGTAGAAAAASASASMSIPAVGVSRATPPLRRDASSLAGSTSLGHSCGVGGGDSRARSGHYHSSGMSAAVSGESGTIHGYGNVGGSSVLTRTVSVGASFTGGRMLALTSPPYGACVGDEENSELRGTFGGPHNSLYACTPDPSSSNHRCSIDIGSEDTFGTFVSTVYGIAGLPRQRSSQQSSAQQLNLLGWPYVTSPREGSLVTLDAVDCRSPGASLSLAALSGRGGSRNGSGGAGISVHHGDSCGGRTTARTHTSGGNSGCRGESGATTSDPNQPSRHHRDRTRYETEEEIDGIIRVDDDGIDGDDEQEGDLDCDDRDDGTDGDEHNIENEEEQRDHRSCSESFGDDSDPLGTDDVDSLFGAICHAVKVHGDGLLTPFVPKATKTLAATGTGAMKARINTTASTSTMDRSLGQRTAKGDEDVTSKFFYRDRCNRTKHYCSLSTDGGIAGNEIESDVSGTAGRTPFLRASQSSDAEVGPTVDVQKAVAVSVSGSDTSDNSPVGRDAAVVDHQQRQQQHYHRRRHRHHDPSLENIDKVHVRTPSSPRRQSLSSPLSPPETKEQTWWATVPLPASIVARAQLVRARAGKRRAFAQPLSAEEEEEHRRQWYCDSGQVWGAGEGFRIAALHNVDEEHNDNYISKVGSSNSQSSSREGRWGAMDQDQSSCHRSRTSGRRFGGSGRDSGHHTSHQSDAGSGSGRVGATAPHTTGTRVASATTATSGGQGNHPFYPGRDLADGEVVFSPRQQTPKDTDGFGSLPLAGLAAHASSPTYDRLPIAPLTQSQQQQSGPPQQSLMRFLPANTNYSSRSGDETLSNSQKSGPQQGGGSASGWLRWEGSTVAGSVTGVACRNALSPISGVGGGNGGNTNGACGNDGERSGTATTTTGGSAGVRSNNNSHHHHHRSSSASGSSTLNSRCRHADARGEGNGYALRIRTRGDNTYSHHSHNHQRRATREANHLAGIAGRTGGAGGGHGGGGTRSAIAVAAHSSSGLAQSSADGMEPGAGLDDDSEVTSDDLLMDTLTPETKATVAELVRDAMPEMAAEQLARRQHRQHPLQQALADRMSRDGVSDSAHPIMISAATVVAVAAAADAGAELEGSVAAHQSVGHRRSPDVCSGLASTAEGASSPLRCSPTAFPRLRTPPSPPPLPQLHPLLQQQQHRPVSTESATSTSSMVGDSVSTRAFYSDTLIPHGSMSYRSDLITCSGRGTNSGPTGNRDGSANGRNAAGGTGGNGGSSTGSGSGSHLASSVGENKAAVGGPLRGFIDFAGGNHQQRQQQTLESSITRTPWPPSRGSVRHTASSMASGAGGVVSSSLPLTFSSSPPLPRLHCPPSALAAAAAAAAASSIIATTTTILAMQPQENLEAPTTFADGADLSTVRVESTTRPLPPAVTTATNTVTAVMTAVPPVPPPPALPRHTMSQHHSHSRSSRARRAPRDAEQQQQQHLQEKEKESLLSLSSSVASAPSHSASVSSVSGEEADHSNDHTDQDAPRPAAEGTVAVADDTPDGARESLRASSGWKEAAQEADGNVHDSGEFGDFSPVAAPPIAGPSAATGATATAASTAGTEVTPALPMFATPTTVMLVETSAVRPDSFWGQHVASSPRPLASLRRQAEQQQRSVEDGAPQRTVHVVDASPMVVPPPSAEHMLEDDYFFPPNLEATYSDEEDSDDVDGDGKKTGKKDTAGGVATANNHRTPSAALMSDVDSAFARRITHAAAARTTSHNPNHPRNSHMNNSRPDAQTGEKTAREQSSSAVEEAPEGGREADTAAAPPSPATAAAALAAPLVRRVQLPGQGRGRGGTRSTSAGTTAAAGGAISGATTAFAMQLSFAPPTPVSISPSLSTASAGAAAAVTSSARVQIARLPLPSSFAPPPQTQQQQQQQKLQQKDSTVSVVDEESNPEVSRASNTSASPGPLSSEAQRIVVLAQEAAARDEAAAERLKVLGLYHETSFVANRKESNDDREVADGESGGDAQQYRYRTPTEDVSPAAAAYLDARRVAQRSTNSSSPLRVHPTLLASVDALLQSVATLADGANTTPAAPTPATSSATNSAAPAPAHVSPQASRVMEQTEEEDAPQIVSRASEAALACTLAALRFPRMRCAALFDETLPLWAAARLPSPAPASPSDSNPVSAGGSTPSSQAPSPTSDSLRHVRRSGASKTATAGSNRAEQRLTASIANTSMLVLNGSVSGARGEDPPATGFSLDDARHHVHGCDDGVTGRSIAGEEASVQWHPIITTADVLMLVEEHRRLHPREQRRSVGGNESLADVLAAAAARSS